MKCCDFVGSQQFLQKCLNFGNVYIVDLRFVVEICDLLIQPLRNESDFGWMFRQFETRSTHGVFGALLSGIMNDYIFLFMLSRVGFGAMRYEPYIDFR